MLRSSLVSALRQRAKKTCVFSWNSACEKEFCVPSPLPMHSLGSLRVQSRNMKSVMNNELEGGCHFASGSMSVLALVEANRHSNMVSPTVLPEYLLPFHKMDSYKKNSRRMK